MLIDFAARRRAVQRLIDMNPFEITIRRKRRTGDDSETTFSFTGTISPATNRLAPEIIPRGQAGEIPPTRQAWVMLADWQEPDMARGDEVTAISPGGITRIFRIATASHYDEKWEVMVYADE